LHETLFISKLKNKNVAMTLQVMISGICDYLSAQCRTLRLWISSICLLMNFWDTTWSNNYY